TLNFLAIIVLQCVSLFYSIGAVRAGPSILAIFPLGCFVNLSLLGMNVWQCGELRWNPLAILSKPVLGKELGMNTQRFVAIAVIFATASAGWCILGNTIDYRTDQLAQSLSREVDTMWGPAGIVQSTPCILTGGLAEMSNGQYDTPIRSDVDVSFEHHNRYKGLIWFSTYTVNFTGTYQIAETQADAMFLFKLPDDVYSLENLTFTIDDEAVEPTDSTTHGVSNTLQVPIASGPARTVIVEYTTRARDRWAYSSQWHTAGRPGLLRNFTLTAKTDFANIDYPTGSVSPTSPAEKTETGAAATWRYQSMRSNQTMGVEMPARTNAGPIASRMSFFAPVSLAFFFTVLFTVVVLKKLPLHPMHYLFISAGFFAFHILMAYLVDLLSIHAAFWICAAVSTALVVSYMRLVAGVKFAVLYVGAAQLVYLVGFSYAFFWVGLTGLTLTIGAIATLFVLMQATGRIDWHEVFSRSPKPAEQWTAVPPLPAGGAPEPENG
ncbi:MAG: inner membrane CreD family protein, partial [Phycisphaerae bacterium]|nr:inner membrane CreD family protein [Phycisphaerae bacterium]